MNQLQENVALPDSAEATLAAEATDQNPTEGNKLPAATETTPVEIPEPTTVFASNESQPEAVDAQPAYAVESLPASAFEPSLPAMEAQPEPTADIDAPSLSAQHGPEAKVPDTAVLALGESRAHQLPWLLQSRNS